VIDTVPSQDATCRLCDGLLATIDELQEQIAIFEGMLADQNAAAACTND